MNMVYAASNLSERANGGKERGINAAEQGFKLALPSHKIIIDISVAVKQITQSLTAENLGLHYKSLAILLVITVPGYAKSVV